MSETPCLWVGTAKDTTVACLTCGAQYDSLVQDCPPCGAPARIAELEAENAKLLAMCGGAGALSEIAALREALSHLRTQASKRNNDG